MRMHARIYKETNKYKRTRIHEEICLYNYVYIYIYIYFILFHAWKSPRAALTNPREKVSRLETRFQSGEKRRKGVEAQTV